DHFLVPSLPAKPVVVGFVQLVKNGVHTALDRAFTEQASAEGVNGSQVSAFDMLEGRAEPLTHYATRLSTLAFQFDLEAVTEFAGGLALVGPGRQAIDCPPALAE